MADWVPDIGYGDGGGLLQDQGAPDTSVSIPTTQASFDTAGLPPGTMKDVLTSGSQAIISITQAIGAVQAARAASAANAAIATQNAKLVAQQQQAGQQVAALQNQTALVRAQAEFNKAAGVVSSSPGIMVVLAVVGVAIAWWGLRRR